ncbi:MAG: UvrD-helicase domain-containing protein [Armatimonadetes bacterium]|nr:UvrD-helicase domain-containing protein [Armatimonadota bacterium]
MRTLRVRRTLPLWEPILRLHGLIRGGYGIAQNFEWTAEQRAVLECDAPRIIVRASAGAGKTGVLVGKYLRFVAEMGYRPDQILTITYTKKAAAEMKSRIVDSLKAQGRFDDAQIAETGPIQTIHSFYERVLRENAIIAGVDPGFEIASSAVTGPMQERAFQAELHEPNSWTPEIAATVLALSARRAYRSDSDELTIAVGKVIEGLQQTGCGPGDLWPIYSTREGYWRHLSTSMAGALPKEIRDSLQDLDHTLFDQVKAIVAERYGAKRGVVPKYFSQKFEPEELDFAITLSVGVAQIALRVWTQVEREMLESQQFDFQLLERLAVELVEREPVVQHRLCRQYRAMLVDETQDVNPIQYRLVDALDLPHVMLVGDPQQSIFAFRGADHRLFIERTDQTLTLPLSRNHRSTPSILSFVDTVFEQIWPENYRPMSALNRDDPFGSREEIPFHDVEYWIQHRGEQPAQPAVRGVLTLLEEGARPGEICVLVRRAEEGGAMRRLLIDAGVPAQFLGQTKRFYHGMVVRDIANALTALAEPNRDFSLLALLRSPFVGLSLDAVVNLASNKPVSHALLDFEPESDEDRERFTVFKEWYLRLRSHADRLSAWEVMGELFEKTPFLERMAARPDAGQNLADARKLLMLAASATTMGPLAYSEHIRKTQRIAYKEGEAPPIDGELDEVTIMTLHSAKGLEFDYVVIPNMNQSRFRMSSPIIVKSHHLAFYAESGSKQPILEWAKDLLRENDDAEELRLLYVALTRAKKRLCLVMPEKCTPGRAFDHLFRAVPYKGTAPKGLKVRFDPRDSNLSVQSNDAL